MFKYKILVLLLLYCFMDTFSPPRGLLHCIFFAAVIIVVLQRFAEDPLIVSDLVYLDDALKGEDGRPRKEGTLEMVRRAV